VFVLIFYVNFHQFLATSVC